MNRAALSVMKFACVPWQSLEGKGKGAVPQWGLGEVLISQTLAVEPVGEWTTESVTHGQCDARPTVTFPAAEPIEYQGQM